MRAARILERLDALFAIDRAAGTNRPGLGAGEQRAFDMVAGWMEDAGLQVSVDPAGNLYGRLPGSDPALAEVWSGSHLDTPPDGGRFDGALGVLAAVEALEAIGGAGGAPRTLAAVAFRLEEGSRFGRGCFGSRAVCGMLEDDEADLRDAEGVTLGEAFAALGLGELPEAGWLDPPPACWVETHIEQGPTLAGAGHPLGVVTLDRRDGGYRDRLRRPPRSRRHDADGAARRRAGRRGRVRHRGAGRRPVDPRGRRTIGRLTVVPRRDQHDPRPLSSCSPTCGRPTPSGWSADLDGRTDAAHRSAADAGCDGRGRAALALRAGADEPGAGGGAPRGDRRARAGAVRAAVRRRPRRGHHGHGRRAARRCCSCAAMRAASATRPRR